MDKSAHEDQEIEGTGLMEDIPKKKRVVKPSVVLDAWYERYGNVKENNNLLTSYYQIGIDEVGRGPLFGRVYTAAVVLPQPSNDIEHDFNYSLMKDSKKFHSAKKIKCISKIDYRADALW